MTCKYNQLFVTMAWHDLWDSTELVTRWKAWTQYQHVHVTSTSFLGSSLSLTSLPSFWCCSQFQLGRCLCMISAGIIWLVHKYKQKICGQEYLSAYSRWLIIGTTRLFLIIYNIVTESWDWFLLVFLLLTVLNRYRHSTNRNRSVHE